MESMKALLREIIKDGVMDANRTDTGTTEIEGYMLKHDMADGFPLPTAKSVNLEFVFHELKFFLKGMTNTAYLKEHGVKIWDLWAVKQDDLNGLPVHTRMTLAKQLCDMDLFITTQQAMEYLAEKDVANNDFAIKQWCAEKGLPWWYNPTPVQVGDLGPVYGKQWVEWVTSRGAQINQIKQLVEQLKGESINDRKKSRRNLVSCWNPEALPDEAKTPEQNVLDGKQALAPCHYVFQLNTQPLNQEQQVANPGKYRRLTLQYGMRSCDTFVGTFYNLASYALLLEMISATCNMVPNKTIHVGMNQHIYNNHLSSGAVDKYLNNPTHPLPRLEVVNRRDNLEDYVWSDFKLHDYVNEGYVNPGGLAK